MKDVWLIGDQFLKEVYNKLPAIKNEAVITKQEMPYLYRYYDIYSYFQCKAIMAANGGLLRIVNALIEAVNKRPRLLRMIIIFPDKDILDALGREFADDNTYDAVQHLVSWLVNFVDRTITARKEDMYQLRPGMINPSETKVIWIQMVHRNPEVPNSQKKAAFNNILEAAIQPKRHNYMINLDESVNKFSYGRYKNLDAATVIDIWANINHQIEEFDKQKRSLKLGSGHVDGNNNRRHLPQPPPLRCRRFDNGDHLDPREGRPFTFAQY